MDYPKQALGFMLRQNRLDQNLSLRALAERTGISAMYLSDVENGVQRPADYTLRKLFSELALPYDPALLWQPEFTLHPLTQAILDYRMDRRDAFFDDLWQRRAATMLSSYWRNGLSGSAVARTGKRGFISCGISWRRPAQLCGIRTNNGIGFIAAFIIRH